jgi:hypothetical protein
MTTKLGLCFPSSRKFVSKAKRGGDTGPGQSKSSYWQGICYGGMIGSRG